MYNALSYKKIKPASEYTPKRHVEDTTGHEEFFIEFLQEGIKNTPVDTIMQYLYGDRTPDLPVAFALAHLCDTTKAWLEYVPAVTRRQSGTKTPHYPHVLKASIPSGAYVEYFHDCVRKTPNLVIHKNFPNHKI